jgi:N-acetylmuramic acid 6-phosphate etherase
MASARPRRDNPPVTDDLDRLSTEQPNPRTTALDRGDTLDTLALINAEDRTVAEAVAAALPAVARAVDLAAERWRRGGRIVLFGAGTSGRLAALDAAELRPTFGVPPERYLARMAGGAGAFQVAVEGAEDDVAAGETAAADLTADDLAFGIAASGRTPWVIGALRAARRQGAATVGLACLAAPALAAECDVAIAIETGPEALAGSTRMKAGTAQKLVLNAFSTALMTRLGKVYRNLMVDVQVTNAKLRRRAIRLVAELAGVDAPTAERALDAAGREVKTAVVALRLGLDSPEARERLAAAEGRLAEALGEH